MAGHKALVFDPRDLYNLLIHYSDGLVPLEGEVVAVLLHPMLKRMIALAVISDEWETDVPLQVRYDGKRILSWSPGDEPKWEERNETPTRQ